MEIESGKSDANRPQLQRAIQACRVYGARLLIAKLDRLSRDAGFLLGLEKAGIEFVAADMPSANRITVGIMAMVAEEERRAISSRTKAALAAAKARGVKLGGDRGATLSTEAKAKGVEAVKARAEGRASDLAPIISDLRASGATSLRSLAAGLNEAGIAPPRGTTWSPMAVSRTLARIDAPV